MSHTTVVNETFECDHPGCDERKEIEQDDHYSCLPNGWISIEVSAGDHDNTPRVCRRKIVCRAHIPDWLLTEEVK